MALRIVSAACLISATIAGSSKIPQGTETREQCMLSKNEQRHYLHTSTESRITHLDNVPHEDEGPNAKYSPSEYCSHSRYVHPRAASRQRLDVVDPGESPPCPEFWF